MIKPPTIQQHQSATRKVATCQGRPLVMKLTHYYLVDTSVVLAGAAVSELQFNMITEEPFIVHNLKVDDVILVDETWESVNAKFESFRDILEKKGIRLSMTKMEYMELKFRSARRTDDSIISHLYLILLCATALDNPFTRLAWPRISDVSEIPEETYTLLEDCDLLILDALRPDRSSSTHFGLPRIIAVVSEADPVVTNNQVDPELDSFLDDMEDVSENQEEKARVAWNQRDVIEEEKEKAALKKKAVSEAYDLYDNPPSSHSDDEDDSDLSENSKRKRAAQKK
ncbi:hypothetical protein KSP39_PZI019929 [Platanthera zijinensis]|uniref:Uncharacterized protein n=1 Tax=Platanthera zijinensis TaxID=2320716 RepID=A0AAP0FX99_9ASPA